MAVASEHRAATAGTSLRIGAAVRVRTSDGRFHRTPRWALGRSGRIVRAFGPWPEPEAVSSGDRTPPLRGLYHVVFPHPDGDLVADVYDHWLEPLPDGCEGPEEGDVRERT